MEITGINKPVNEKSLEGNHWDGRKYVLSQSITSDSSEISFQTVMAFPNGVRILAYDYRSEPGTVDQIFLDKDQFAELLMVAHDYFNHFGIPIHHLGKMRKGAEYEQTEKHEAVVERSYYHDDFDPFLDDRGVDDSLENPREEIRDGRDFRRYE